MSEVNTNCPFCSVAPDRAIRSDNLFVSLLSDPRLRKGHALVVPKRHVEKPMDLQPDELLAIYKEIQRLQTCIVGALAPGCDTWQKYQPFVPQGRIKVDHVHFHVVPRSPTDRLFLTPEENQWDAFTALDPSEQHEMLALLRNSQVNEHKL